jgi:uncharacterized protein (DUF4415 family)
MRKANDREKRDLGGDLKKVDRHVIQPREYEEIPELTGEMAARADLYRGGKLIRRGRPKSDDPKQLITLRLDAAVLRWFQQSGPGYQSRIGAALKSHMTRKKAAAKTPSRARRCERRRRVKFPCTEERQWCVRKAHSSCPGLTRASIKLRKNSFEGDGLPGQARQ